MGRREKAKTPGAAAGELVNKSVPAQKGPWGPGAGKTEKARRGVGGVGCRGWGCRARQGKRCGRRPERFPPAPPGLTHAPMARASSRPAQARGRRRGRGRGRGGSHTGTRDRRKRPACHPPPAEGTVGGPRLAPRPPRLPGVSRCSLQPARRAPAPTPEGRYLGAPALTGASWQRSKRPSSSLIRRQRQQKAREGGGGDQKPALPAAVAASRNSSRRSPCAPQRSAAAGGSGRPLRAANARGRGAAASPPFLSPRETPGGATPPSRTRAPGGARERRPHLLGGGSGMGGVSLPLSPPWGLSSTPISWGISRFDLPPGVTPPLLSRRCSTCP